MLSYQSLMPAGAGAPRYERPGLSLGTENSPRILPRPSSDPSGGQAPALHLLVPPSTIGLQLGRFRRWRAGIEVDWRAHPGSESGVMLSYQSLMPAGAGAPRYERRSPGFAFVPIGELKAMLWLGTANSLGDSATPHPDPSGGQAPALHLLVPPSTIGLQLGRFRRWRAGIKVDWRAHPGSESGVMLSYQSLMPAGAGAPRYERPMLWLGTANSLGEFCHAPPPPQRGTSPSPRVVFDRTTFSRSAIDHRSTTR